MDGLSLAEKGSISDKEIGCQSRCGKSKALREISTYKTRQAGQGWASIGFNSKLYESRISGSALHDSGAKVVKKVIIRSPYIRNCNAMVKSDRRESMSSARTSLTGLHRIQS